VNGKLVYLDTSALRPLFVHEQRSRRVTRYLQRYRVPVRITRFGHAELINSIAWAVFREDISPAQFAAALAELEADLKSQRILLVDILWRAALDRATELSRMHTPKLGNRMLDVLHVASAVELGAAMMITYDKRQAELAISAGLRAISP
jgi:predicted nucleic acid-binding protein